jgi:hypothetical protein
MLKKILNSQQKKIHDKFAIIHVEKNPKFATKKIHDKFAIIHVEKKANSR